MAEKAIFQVNIEVVVDVTNPEDILWNIIVAGKIRNKLTAMVEQGELDSLSYQFDHFDSELEVPVEIKVLANGFVMVNKMNGWPEDDWITLDRNWDLNLYSDGNFDFAVVYPVRNGSTDSRQGLICAILKHESSQGINGSST